MKPNLDNKIFFDNDGFCLKVKTIKRQTIEKTVPSLDGCVCVDLGKRKRNIEQSGVLRAKSSSGIKKIIATINELFDGQVHTLTTPNGDIYQNLKIESFQTSEQKVNSAAIYCNYEIIYIQLM